MSLTTSDLKAIEQLIEKTIIRVVPAIVEEIVEKKFEVLRQDIAAGFAEVHARIDALEERAVSIEKKLDNHILSTERNFSIVTHRLDALTIQTSSHEIRLVKIETLALKIVDEHAII